MEGLVGHLHFVDARRRSLPLTIGQGQGGAAKRELGSLWSRRDFMGRLGWGAFGAFTGITLLGFLRSAFPRVLFQPPSSFKAGLPKDYTVGEISEKL